MTPCILPWINFGTNLSGRPRVCGYSDIEKQWKQMFRKRDIDWIPTLSENPPEGSFNSLNKEFGEEYLKWVNKLDNSSIEDQWNGLYFKEIRKSFLNNEWPENCNRCKHVEELNGVSKRMDENHMWFDKYEHLISHTMDDGDVNVHPFHIDVRTGTICNFKCIHCNPAVSSRWLEDRTLIEKYNYIHRTGYDTNAWISQDSAFWDNLDISQIKRYNFLGGESFWNKRHNEFIKRLNGSSYAKNVEISYVSNGSLKFENMENFKKVRLRLSVDCVERAGEYFRYGLKWDEWCNNLKEFPSNFDVSFQWTCSNVSMFYLIDTYDFLRENFPNIRFLFENHVTEPYHLSAQNLPIELKNEIKKNIDSYMFTEKAKEVLPFYINFMFEKDGWSDNGDILINYLNDLDKARNTNWKESLCGLETRLSGLI